MGALSIFGRQFFRLSFSFPYLLSSLPNIRHLTPLHLMDGCRFFNWKRFFQRRHFKVIFRYCGVDVVEITILLGAIFFLLAFVLVWLNTSLFLWNLCWSQSSQETRRAGYTCDERAESWSRTGGRPMNQQQQMLLPSLVTATTFCGRWLPSSIFKASNGWWSHIVSVWHGLFWRLVHSCDYTGPPG